MPIIGIILIFIYIMIIIFAMLAGFISAGNGTRKERLSLVFSMAAWAFVIALVVFVIKATPSEDMELCILAICLAVFVEKVFYMIMAEITMIKKYGLDDIDYEQRDVVFLVIIAVALIIGICFTVIRLSGCL